MTRVLVTDSNTRPALAATRSLAKAGHVVITCGDVDPSLAGVSRFSSVHELCPSPSVELDHFVGRVREIAARHRIDVLLPMTEISTLALSGDALLRAAGVKTPFGDAAIVANAANKATVVKLARELGIPVPATIELGCPEDLDIHVSSLRASVVIKPARSRVLTASGWLSASVSYAEDLDSLRRQLALLPMELFPVLLQERIEGPGVGMFMYVDGGRMLASFAHERIREMPPSGGVSVLCESRATDPVGSAHAEKLLAHLQWKGPAMVEFKRDRRDGNLRLMEVNGRFWGSLQLAIDAGVDFPGIAVDAAVGNAVAPPTSYRTGVRSRWFWGDASAMLLLLTRGSRSLSLPPTHPGRWRTFLEFMRLWDAKTRNEVLRSDDWRPFLLESKRWLQGR